MNLYAQPLAFTLAAAVIIAIEFWTPTPNPKPQVQVIYAIPSDRKENPDYADAIRDAILHVQNWYAEQLDGLTFSITTPIPLICSLDHEARYFEGMNGWDRVGASVQHCAPVEHWSEQYVWVVYVDAEFDCDGGGELGMGSRGLAIVHAGDLRGLLNPDTFTLCPGWPPRGKYGWIGGLAHELGHAFELRHPPGCEPRETTQCATDALMWFGFYWDYPDTYLTGEDKDILSTSPWFWKSTATVP